ncbi:MAG: ATP-dependent helicase, partial [Planctomycetaceae bacterium]
RQGGRSACMVRIFVGAGRTAGIRPQDLVGAIAGESGISGKDIGAIKIEERFSLVELPADRADDVLMTMRNSLIKGKKVTIRRFVER